MMAYPRWKGTCLVIALRKMMPTVLTTPIDSPRLISILQKRTWMYLSARESNIDAYKNVR